MWGLDRSSLFGIADENNAFVLHEISSEEQPDLTQVGLSLTTGAPPSFKRLSSAHL